MRFAMGRVNRFCPASRRFARLELKASVTKHMWPPAALLAVKQCRRVKQWLNPGLFGLADWIFRNTSYSSEWPPTIFAVACDVKIFMATKVLVFAELSLYWCEICSILVGIYEELTARATQRKKQPNPAEFNDQNRETGKLSALFGRTDSALTNVQLLLQWNIRSPPRKSRVEVPPEARQFLPSRWSGPWDRPPWHPVERTIVLLGNFPALVTVWRPRAHGVEYVGRESHA